MTEAVPLAGCRMLIVEGNWLISCDLKRMLARHGAVVIGPVATIDGALNLLRQNKIDLAFIDVSPNDELVQLLVNELTYQKIPFAFMASHLIDVLPTHFSVVPIVEKPFDTSAVIAEAQRLHRGP